MWSTRTLTALAVLLWAAPTCRADPNLAPYDPATMTFPVSPDAAVASARQWAGDSSLSLQLAGIYQMRDVFRQDDYEFDAPGGQHFFVNCYSGQVWKWRSDPAAQACHDHYQQSLSSPLPRLALSDQEQSALRFARAHYPGFDALNMRLSASDDNGYSSGYSHFETGLPGGGFFTGNSCHIFLDPFSGDVYEYYQRVAGLITVPLQPRLAAADAENIVLGPYFSYPRSAFTYRPSRLDVTVDSLGQQRLVWGVWAAFSGEPDFTLQRWIDQSHLGASTFTFGVDAFTGEVVFWEEWQGAPHDRGPRDPRWRSRERHFALAKPGARATTPRLDAQRPEVLVDGRSAGKVLYAPLKRGADVYWAAVYLRSPLWGMTIRRSGRTLVVTGSCGARARLRDGSRWARIGGRAVRLAAAPFVLRGRTYLPLSAWERITGSRFEWSPAKNALLIDTRTGRPLTGHG